jgi:hypothetical protein
VSINFFSLELHAVPKHSIKDVGRGEGRPVASSLFMLSQCQLSAHEITHQTPPMQTRHIKAKSNSFYVVEAFSLLSFALDVEELCLLEHKVMTSHYHTLGWLITVFPLSRDYRGSLLQFFTREKEFCSARNSVNAQWSNLWLKVNFFAITQLFLFTPLS